MCLTLPETLITVMGIEKVVPTWSDLEVFLQLLPRSSTGERMNPYTSAWTGVTPGDGPQAFHLVLLDNGRTAALTDPVGRSALHCIRCSACLNVCPVYERAGGHAYGSVYPGPIGAVLSPQLTGVEDNASLPYASSLCGACFDACPVRIDIPSLLVQLRAAHVDANRDRRVPTPEALGMAAAAWVMADPQRFAAAEKATRAGRLLGRATGRITTLPPPLSRWTASRDAPRPPAETFREWWARDAAVVGRERAGGGAAPDPRRERRRPADAPSRCRATTTAPARTRRARRSWSSCCATGSSTTARPSSTPLPTASRPRWRGRSPSTPARYWCRPACPTGGARTACPTAPSPRRSWTASPPSSPGAPRPAPRPAPSPSTARPTRAAAPSPSCPTSTSASCAPSRSCTPSPS